MSKQIEHLVEFRGLVPTIADDVFLADGARLVGDVQIGAGSSVWFNTVLRGDIYSIRIGAGTNLQDLVLGHTSTGRTPLIVGDSVTVGHGAILHGATVEEGVLIGMGAIVLDQANIGAGAIVAAGALVREGTNVPPGTLWAGVPARQVRELDEEQRKTGILGAEGYRQHAAEYRRDAGTEKGA